MPKDGLPAHHSSPPGTLVMNYATRLLIPTESPASHRDLFYPPYPMPLSPQETVIDIKTHEMQRVGMSSAVQLPSSPTETVSIIQTYFTAYEEGDRDTVSALLAEDFSFSSPLNHRVDRDSYFRNCWPMNPHITLHIERIFEKGNEAFVTYECERNDGTRFRNTGFFILRDGGIRHIHIYCDSPEDLAPWREPSPGIMAAALS
ncbi:Ketosteroid isomerase-related protein [Prosthecobacter debontii]|uniref:Ketosteroid isomerase-related protein n=1 Tax=Prosthecobacter debontii TaxID=48467 RepID=A0A1T4Y1D6_9BACT|nr:nuclear transport factor 2 family protein [Prosthecobacter debontii]SKA95131.1 Ketosteroid isomerase-related protein [Prosthecobacter debontii]